MNILHKIQEIAQQHPDRLALVSEHNSISYSELVTQAAKVATKFEHIAPGSAVGFGFIDTVASAVVRLGLLQRGALLVPLMPRLTTAEIDRRRVAGKCDFVVADNNYESLSNCDALVINDLEAFISDTAPSAKIESTEDFELSILWSSGTGGDADGLVHSHSTVANIAKTFVVIFEDNKDAVDVVYAAAPLNSTFGILYMFFGLYHGATVVIEAQPFSPAVVANNIKRFRVTHFAASPPVYSILCRKHALELDEVPPICVVAGDICSTKLQHQWLATYNKRMYNFLGSSQTGVGLVGLPSDPIGSLGTGIASVEVRLLGEDGQEAATGTPGEIWLKSEHNAVREITNGVPSIDNGWITTRDIFIKQPSGQYYIQGRSKDTFKVNGLFVSPVAVEDAIREVPEVDDVIAIRGINEHGLSCVKAYVVPYSDSGHDSLVGKIKAHTQKLYSHERPHVIEFISELPRHPATMKLQRSLLHETC